MKPFSAAVLGAALLFAPLAALPLANQAAAQTPPATRARRSAPKWWCSINSAQGPRLLCAAYLSDSAMPFKSTLMITPAERPASESTAPFWLVSTIACAPAPTAPPAPAAA